MGSMTLAVTLVLLAWNTAGAGLLLLAPAFSLLVSVSGLSGVHYPPISWPDVCRAGLGGRVIWSCSVAHPWRRQDSPPATASEASSQGIDVDLRGAHVIDQFRCSRF